MSDEPLPDERFIEQVREVLEHLYDYPYLYNHPLIEWFTEEKQSSRHRQRRFLQTLFLKSIEELDPGSNAPFRSPQARDYNVLRLHYVEGMPIKDLAIELAISERQAYRDLRKAEQDLAFLLWPLCQRQQESEKNHAPNSLLTEAKRLGAKREEMDLKAMLEGAFEAVRPLAEAKDVRLDLRAPTTPLTIRSHAMFSRQVTIGVLSHTIQHAHPQSDIRLWLTQKQQGAQITLGCTIAEEAIQSWLEALAIPQELIEFLGEQWQIRADQTGQRFLSFTLGSNDRFAVLVIDDNEGLIELFRRYLTNDRYHLVSAQDGETAMRLTEEYSPDTIVLDVMMPHQDGWEVLQMLRHRETTHDTPIIICSVINDPGLAFALGATEFLAKPVKQEDLLRVLDRCVG